MAKSEVMSLTAIFISLGVVLSFYPGSISVGPTKILPYHHLVNILSGIILGPIYAVFIATSIGILRYSFGIGTIFAFSGGIPGAFVVGFLYHHVKRSNYVALTEPVGTSIGALISAFVIQPFFSISSFPSFLGLTEQWQIFLAVFLFSSIPGTIMGFLILVALRRRGMFERFLL